MKISITCPTRNRPYQLFRFITNVFETADSPNDVEIIFYVDEDDSLSKPVIDELAAQYNLVTFVGPRIPLGQMHNECVGFAAGEIVAFFGDDVLFRTPKWDVVVRNAIARHPDGIVLTYGDDKINGQKLGTHAFTTIQWVKVLGYLTPPYYTSYFSDTHCNELAENLGRRVYLPDVVFEHMHWSVGKSAADDTTREVAARNSGGRNDQLWHQMLSHRIADTQKLLAYINKMNGTNKQLGEYRRLI